LYLQASSSPPSHSSYLSFTHGVLEARNGNNSTADDGMSFCVIYYPNITTTYPSEKEEGVCIIIIVCVITHYYSRNLLIVFDVVLHQLGLPATA